MTQFKDNTAKFVDLVPEAKVGVDTATGDSAFDRDTVLEVNEDDLGIQGAQLLLTRVNDMSPVRSVMMIEFPEGSFFSNRIKREKPGTDAFVNMVSGALDNAGFGGNHTTLTAATAFVNEPSDWDREGVRVRIDFDIFIPEELGTGNDFYEAYVAPVARAFSVKVG